MRFDAPAGCGAASPGTAEDDPWSSTVKELSVTAVVLGAKTAIGPVVAAAGTVALRWSSSRTSNFASTPLNVTATTSVRPEPFNWTTVPTAPAAGAKLAMPRARGLSFAAPAPATTSPESSTNNNTRLIGNATPLSE